jgi:hypothetical protein
VLVKDEVPNGFFCSLDFDVGLLTILVLLSVAALRVQGRFGSETDMSARSRVSPLRAISGHIAGASEAVIPQLAGVKQSGRSANYGGPYKAALPNSRKHVRHISAVFTLHRVRPGLRGLLIDVGRFAVDVYESLAHRRSHV